MGLLQKHLEDLRNFLNNLNPEERAKCYAHYKKRMMCEEDQTIQEDDVFLKAKKRAEEIHKQIFAPDECEVQIIEYSQIQPEVSEIVEKEFADKYCSPMPDSKFKPTPIAEKAKHGI